MRFYTVAAALTLVMIAVVPLAYASPMDPTWIAGLWDNDDPGAAIFAAASGVGVLDAAPPAAVRRLPVIVAVLGPASVPRVTPLALPTPEIRAPPTA